MIKLTRRYNNVITVDPGYNGTGWSLFPFINRTGCKSKAIPPKESGVIRVQPALKKLSYTHRAIDIGCRFDALFFWSQIQLVVIEGVKLYAGSEISYAGTAKGYLFELSYLVGYLGHIVYNRTGKAPLVIDANEWKGQMDKDVVKARIRRAFSNLDLDYPLRDHEADAIGMGLALQGKL